MDSNTAQTHTTVRALAEHPNLAPSLRQVAGEKGLDRIVDHPRIQKSGLILVGHVHGIVRTRVQILGETEISYLESLSVTERTHRLEALFQLGLSCVIVTRGVAPLPELVAGAQSTDTPLFVAASRSSTSIALVHATLDRLLAPQERRHGVMVEVHGIGILLLGPSGIGKSEAALFLVERGHRLVADDQVWLTRLPNLQVTATPAPLLRHHLEIRGLGILNVRDLFGATAVWDEVVVDLVAELCPWQDEAEYERLGIDEQHETLLGVDLPKLKIPVRPGRNMAVILEIAARNALLKAAGHHSAREFAKRLSRQLGLSQGAPESDSKKS